MHYNAMPYNAMRCDTALFVKQKQQFLRYPGQHAHYSIPNPSHSSAKGRVLGTVLLRRTSVRVPHRAQPRWRGKLRRRRQPITRVRSPSFERCLPSRRGHDGSRCYGRARATTTTTTTTEGDKRQQEGVAGRRRKREEVHGVQHQQQQQQREEYGGGGGGDGVLAFGVLAVVGVTDSVPRSKWLEWKQSLGTFFPSRQDWTGAIDFGRSVPCFRR
mmetsp:Transcript_16481/g.35883  ORF Transcript_16481/g.35883 Transcript_16481/m.35883 type:complete len:215 (+) Transcript_16481:250-894(+)